MSYGAVKEHRLQDLFRTRADPSARSAESVNLGLCFEEAVRAQYAAQFPFQVGRSLTIVGPRTKIWDWYSNRSNRGVEWIFHDRICYKMV